ncbi:MAG: glycosyltransferase family protein [Nanoarchaeota archaeon]
MRILFVISGFGYGDTIRMKAIISELRKRVSDLRIMIVGYGNSYNYFHKKYLTLKIGKFYFSDRGNVFGLSFVVRNLFYPIRMFFDWRKHSKSIIKFSPDIIISDVQPFSVYVAERINKPLIRVFAYDQELYSVFPKKNSLFNIQAKVLSLLGKRTTHLFVPSFFKSKTKGNTHYLPAIIKTTSASLDDETSLMKKLNLKRKPVIVSLGGSNFGFGLAEIIRKNISKFDDDFIFFGTEKTIAAYHYNFRDNYLEYLKVAKAVISLGGSMSFAEAIAFKKPVLAFPLKGHLEQNLNAYALRGVICQGDVSNPVKAVSMFLKKLPVYQKKINGLHANYNGAQVFVDFLLKNYG